MKSMLRAVNNQKKSLMKNIMLLMSLILVMMMIGIVAADNETNQIRDEWVEYVDGLEVIHEVTSEPSLEDADWPIIFQGLIVETDDKTGEKHYVHTVIRRMVSSNGSVN